MKKLLILLLTLTLCLSFMACGETKNDKNTPTKAAETKEDPKHPAEYVDEWKNYRKIDSEGNYGTFRVVFNADGTGSYFNSSDKETKGTWYYDADNHCVVLQLPVGNCAFYVQEENGKTVLDYYDDIFYRAGEFEPITANEQN